MKNTTQRRWNDLPRWQRTATMVLAPVELALTVAAAVDLSSDLQGSFAGPRRSGGQRSSCNR